jgi:pimeloyl-ACP methyl ester carboxylesterase
MSDAFTSSTTVDADGRAVHVAEAGKGTPIVLLHGNPDTHSVWAPVVSGLADRFRCIAPDLPGYGESDAPRDDQLSLEGQARWVLGVVDALKLDRFHLVVHDVGGAHGLAFSTLHPQRLRSLTIMNTTFFPDYRWHFWARVWRTRIAGEAVMKLGGASFMRSVFRRELLRGSPKMTREYADHAFDAYTPRARATVLRWYRATNPAVYVGWDQRLLASIEKVPRQVIWGDHDPFIPAATADRFGGTVHRLSNCGHWAMIEDPSRVSTEIAALCGTT